MDTGYDFIQPEFLNILFFQQKSLVIAPYVDLKHLHSLEIFTVGYNVVDLDSTALHNISEIVELENNNSYSQTPCFFFITNINSNQLHEIIELDNIHCVINACEKIDSTINNGRFVFYNKKNGSFLNYDPTKINLEFEKQLINNSKNKSILQDKILRIKSIATTIFTELNEELNINSRKISQILSEYDPKYWDKILDFTRRYYKIEIPKADIKFSFNKKSKHSNKKSLIDFSDEYHTIVSSNKKLGREFIQLLHDYRSRRVNPSNLDLEQLYNPQKLYEYLRNNHWKNGIDREFLTEWQRMNNTKYTLDKDDLSDFYRIFNILKVPEDILINFSTEIMNYDEPFASNKEVIFSEQNNNKDSQSNSNPSIKNFPQFKKWVLKKLDEIEKLL
ncbi:MAG: hypothetical protein ACFFBT_14345 [Promethearchaeota archaeon]